MPLADPGQPAAEPADDAADDLDEATRIVRRGGSRQGSAALPEAGSDLDDDTIIVQRTAGDSGGDDNDNGDDSDTDSDDTVIVQRTADERTRRVARQPRTGGPTVAADKAGQLSNTDTDTDIDDEATVRASRGSTAADTLLSSRRAATPVHVPVADALQRRYEPPQVKSGASVRYAARPTPTIIAPKALLPVADAQPDAARLRLADAAAEIRERAAAVKRRRRRLTLIAIISITVLVVLAAAGYTAFILFTW